MCMCACDTLLIVLIHNIKGDSEGQGILACCSPWGRRVGHDLATEQQQQSIRKNFLEEVKIIIHHLF